MARVLMLINKVDEGDKSINGCVESRNIKTIASAVILSQLSRQCRIIHCNVQLKLGGTRQCVESSSVAGLGKIATGDQIKKTTICWTSASLGYCTF